MYGKAFESMYEGSMVNSGINVFAVWNYVIAKTRRGVIELNPALLSFILGGAEEQIVDAIDFLCAPDPKSRTQVEEGRRLVREGQFQYRVVNWEKYNGIKNELDRREYNRVKQAEHRAKERDGKGRKSKVSRKKGPLPGELAYVKACKNGEELDANDYPVRETGQAAVEPSI